jgi:hypothetical protein
MSRGTNTTTCSMASGSGHSARQDCALCKTGRKTCVSRPVTRDDAWHLHAAWTAGASATITIDGSKSQVRTDGWTA